MVENDVRRGWQRVIGRAVAWIAAMLIVGCNAILGIEELQTFPPSEGGAGGSGGTTGGCTEPGDCGDDTTCLQHTCVDGICGEEHAAEGTPCTEDGGQVCDGQGSCVECLDASQCSPEEICDTTIHVCVTAPCDDGLVNGPETDVDCGGGVCPPCDNGLKCLEALDCVSRFCEGAGGAGGAGGSAGAGGAGSSGGAGGGAPLTCQPCSTDGDCSDVADTYCSSGVCEDQKPDGATCAGDDECLSSHCPPQDGVCCDTACDQTCEACLQCKTSGNDGVCALIPSSDDPDAECTDQGAASCGPNGTGCAGTSAACNLYDATTECSAAVCTGGQETAAEHCDGLGLCVPETPVACAPYTCDGAGVGCLASCTLQSDCAAGSYCVGTGTCVAKKIDGALCTAPAAGYECLSGSCVDGVCCNTACSGSCEACTAVLNGGTDGTCGFIPIYQDPQNDCPLPGEVCGGDGTCINELAGGGLLVRYFMDEAASGQTPLQLLDSGPAALHLALDYNASTTEMVYVEDAGNRGLFWNPVGNGSRASIGVDGTVIANLNGSTTGTIEVVCDIDDVVAQGTRISHIGDGSGENGRFTLSADSTGVLQVSVNILAGEYPVNLPAAGRIVVHAVLDTNEAVATDRIKLYVDGGTPLTATGGTPPAAGATIILGAGRSYVIGNHISQTRSPLGKIYYAALYSSALTAAEVAQNAAVLSVSDDAP